MIDLGAVLNGEIEINEIKKLKNQRKEFENFQLYHSGKNQKPNGKSVTKMVNFVF